MSERREEAYEFEIVSESDAHAILEEQYRDPAGAMEFFERMISQKQRAVSSFIDEVNQDESLAEELRANPIQLFRERRLIGPHDLLQVDLLDDFFPFPWPLPWCRIVCSWEPKLIVEWVCVGFGPFKICWPRLRIVLRLRCRLVCNW